MKNTYGYKPLSYELIDLFQSGAPDFAAAEDLIRRGADVNDQGDDKGENVLSEILMGYWWTSGTAGMEQEVCSNCESRPDRCAHCEHNLNPNAGSSMIEIIRLFLDHGFDVNRNNGRHGAQCLSALALSSFDRQIITATKLLLDAGAQNIPVEDDPSETPMNSIGEEGSYQDVCEHNHYLGNIYEATYQIYAAARDGRSYSGIDSFEAAIGKKVLYVMADCERCSPAFSSVDLPQSKHDNCFYCNLYLLFDGGHLVCTKYANYWVDTLLPDKPLTDVSRFFAPILGHTIQQVSFDHRSISKGTTFYGQPITTLHMDNGITLTFTINFGEVDRSDYCSYFYYNEA
ncbi:MAG: hypothetical protein IJU66_07355 [Oscillospiraceae bacterium]|nr:hypothetical protein [Oscillospiraceae bacterium]